MRHWILSLVALTLLGAVSVCQMSTLPAAQAIAELPGAPQNPPIFSPMTAMMQDGLQFQDNVNFKGPVASATREESASDQNHSYHTKSTLKFDEDGHLINRIFEDSLGVTTLTNIWEHGKLQSQTVEHHRNDGKEWSEWQKWSYDTKGRLAEFHAGRDKQEMNDFVNFKYDEDGRPLGFELSGQTLTEIKYEGRKITLSRTPKYQKITFFEQVQIIDDKNRAVDLKVSDLSGGQLTQWYHVRFKYDDKGRVIEQNTDPYKVGDGDDYSPVPGKFVVEYNDEKRSGEQKFYDPGDKLVLHTKFEFDRDGALTKLRGVDASGKEQTSSETFFDQSNKLSTRAGNTEWEIVYDDHGNWTERRRWFTPADGGPRIMKRVIHQDITYR